MEGPAADGVPADDTNLVRRALRAVGRSAAVHVDKHIPPGAGLGGGSADAAAVLRWAGCDDLELAAGLGADVPFCVRGGRARVGGIGEVVEPLPFVDLTFTLCTPPLGVLDAARSTRRGTSSAGPAADGPNDLDRGGDRRRAPAGDVARPPRRGDGRRTGSRRERRHLVRRGLVPERGRRPGPGDRGRHQNRPPGRLSPRDAPPPHRVPAGSMSLRHAESA